MIPEVRFLIVDNLGDGWAADSVSYFVDDVYENTISIKASKYDVKVRDSINIDVETEPNSKVFFLAVDKSVKLLKTGNDIEEKRVLALLQEAQEKSWRPWPFWGGCGVWFPWSYGESPIDKIDDAGMKVIEVRSNYELWNGMADSDVSYSGYKLTDVI